MASIMLNIAGIFNSEIKWNPLKNEKIFLNFLFHFWNLHQILNISKKKMTVLANVFSKCMTLKNILATLCNKRCFGTRLDNQTCETFPNTCKISMRILLQWFFINLRQADSENISPRVR